MALFYDERPFCEEKVRGLTAISSPICTLVNLKKAVGPAGKLIRVRASKQVSYESMFNHELRVSAYLVVFGPRSQR